MPPTPEELAAAAAKAKADAANAGNEGGDQPKYLTEEAFNKAWSAREKRSQAALDKLLTDRFAAFAPKSKDDDADDDDDADAAAKAKAAAAAGGAGNDPNSARIRKLEKQLEREKAERETEKKAREEQSAKSQREEERSKLSELLAAAGVTGPRLKGAIALLHTEDHRVRRNADGKIVFVPGDDEDDAKDLAAGVKEWLGTEEGKAYAPARGAQGAGTERVRGTSKAATSSDPKTQRAATAREMFVKAVTGR